MRNRVGVILGLALVSGLLAAYLAFNFLRQPTTDAPVETVQTEGTTVLVAIRDLNAGHLLQQEDVRAIAWPEGDVPDGYGRDPAEVVGRGLLADIRRNEPILASKISLPGAGNGLQLMIAEGMRAHAVRVTDEVGVAYWLHGGMRVDVNVTLDQAANVNEATTQTILQDLRVLRVGQEQGVDDQNQPITVSVVVLEVSPDEAQMLTLATTKATIRLVLRNPLDRDTLQLRGIRARELITGRQVVSTGGARRAAPPPRRTIEVIQGTEVTTKETNGNGGGN